MLQPTKDLLKRVPGLAAVVRSDAYKAARHRALLPFFERGNKNFTQFLRLPTQYDALVGPVLEFLGAAGRGAPIRLLDVGCSTGSEPYGVASVLASRRPEVAFEILAIDIVPEVVERARSRRYTRGEVHARPVPSEFVERTFLAEGDGYVIRPEIADRVTFRVHDVTDPDLPSRLGTFDVVLAQNVLINLPPRAARAMFRAIARFLAPRSALFVDGVDLGLRAAMTRRLGLEPLDYRVREIHDEARFVRGAGWPWQYWGLEPFRARSHDPLRRYATIFLRNDGTRLGNRGTAGGAGTAVTVHSRSGAARSILSLRRRRANRVRQDG